jgi:hypothetical protein
LDKLDPVLKEAINASPPPDPLRLMIRTPDGLQPADQAKVEAAGGTVLANLDIVQSFSVELPLEGLKGLLNEPRFLSFHHDAPLLRLD